jgi:SAM-dependent methyltransferase
MSAVTSPNEEAIRAWDGVLFDRFVQFRSMVAEGLAPHGEAALQRHPPHRGDRVIDLGCGFGDSTVRIGELVGPQGEAVGLDVSPRFIAAAREEARDAPNVSFLVADLQTTSELGGPYDAAFSRFGTMFFASPVAALRNVAGALKPGGRLTMTVWRRKLDNPWMHRAELLVKTYLEKPDDSDEPTCGPGPFSMANADTVCDVLAHAGFTEVELFRCDRDILCGEDLDRAIALVMSLGPGAEVLRLLGDRADHMRPRIVRELREELSAFVREDGRVYGPSSTWIVSAVRP